MPVIAKYDPDADALYVRLADGVRQRAIEVDDATYVDIDGEGRVLGLELLYPSLGLNLDGVAQRFKLHQQLPVIVTAIADAAAPGVPTTLTGGAHMASSSTVTMVVEGTVPAGSEVVESSVAHAEPATFVPL